MAVETRPIAPFERIDLRGVGNLHVTQAPVESLRLEADEETLRYVETSVEGGALVIRYRWWESLLAFRAPASVDIYVGARVLRALNISGTGRADCPSLSTDTLALSVSGSAKIDFNVGAYDLSCSISGAGDYVLRGQTGRFDATINGAGDVRAEGLATRETHVSISGSGSARMRVTEVLDVSISGSGTVEYIGDPRVTQRVSGSGRIARIG